MPDTVDKDARRHIDSMHSQLTQRNRATKKRIDDLETRLIALELIVKAWEATDES